MSTLHILVFLYYPIFYLNPSTKPSAVLKEYTIDGKIGHLDHDRPI